MTVADRVGDDLIDEGFDRLELEAAERRREVEGRVGPDGVERFLAQVADAAEVSRGRGKRRGRRLPKTITEAEFDRLVSKASTRAPTGIRNAAMLWLMWDAGLRVSDVIGLAPGDILDVHGAAPQVRVRHGKGDKDRYVPLRAAPRRAVLAWLEARGRGGPWLFCTISHRGRLSDRYVRAMVERYSRRAGVLKTVQVDGVNVERPINPHMLRHSFATRMIRDFGLDLDELQEVLGHEDIATTRIYTHVSQEQIAEKMRAGLELDDERDGDDLEAVMARVLRRHLGPELVEEIADELRRSARVAA